MSRFLECQTKILDGEVLDEECARNLMGDILDGEIRPIRIAALLTSLATRGEAASELAGFARAMLDRAEIIEAPTGAVDTCGTGGSGKATVNTSTLVAFALAAEGVPVAKHGNRASSGRCGSTDVLERAGVEIDLPPAVAQELLRREGLAFLYAPYFHPALKLVAEVRRDLGFRTVFNFLGPLCNPARVRRQLLGVSSTAHAEGMVVTLERLGCERALVVAGQDGLDEISLCAPTSVWFLDSGEISHGVVAPEDFGFERVDFDAIAGGTPERNEELFHALLDGSESAGARLDHLALNVAAGLWVAGRVDHVVDGVALARDLVRSGRLRERFESYRRASRSMT